MKTKNDVAVRVLAYAKPRIGEFFRRMCACLSSRFCGASIKLMMTDTDSVACSVHVPILLILNRRTGRLAFESNIEKKRSTFSTGQ